MPTIERIVALESIDESGNPTIDLPITSVECIEDFPSAMPANGGNAATVGGHTVLSDVPANAKFTDTNTTYSNMTAATASAAGKAGLVPAPAAGAQGKYLRGDGTWQTPPDTNTTYSAATQSANGLMSAADKKKLDGIAAGANVNTITGVKGNAESTYRTGNVNITPDNIGAAAASHTHAASAITGLPTSLPANGGNAATVGGYSPGAGDSAGLAVVTSAYGVMEIGKYIDFHTKAGQDYIFRFTANDDGTLSISSTINGNISGNAGTVNGHTVNSDVPANAKFTDTNTTYGDASATASGLVNTGAQTFGGNKTFNGQILPAGASAAGTPQARKLASGTAAATATNCPSGAWYGKH